MKSLLKCVCATLLVIKLVGCTSSEIVNEGSSSDLTSIAAGGLAAGGLASLLGADKDVVIGSTVVGAGIGYAANNLLQRDAAQRVIGAYEQGQRDAYAEAGDALWDSMTAADGSEYRAYLAEKRNKGKAGEYVNRYERPSEPAAMIDGVRYGATYRDTVMSGN